MPNPLQRAEIGQAALSLVDETPIPAGYEAEGVKWGGCATLNPDDPKLWIVAKTDRARTNDEVHGFTLAEVIEARLRAKIVGLAESDRNAAIADCVEDTLYHIKTLVFGGANERADLANSNESENHTMQNGESAMKEADAPSTATEEFLGCPELVLQEHPDGRVTGVAMREMRSSFHVTFADGFAEPEEVERGIAILRQLDRNGEYGSWKKEANIDAASLDEAIASSPESSRGQKFVCLYRDNEWLWGIWNNPNKDSVLAGSFHLSSVADFHGTRVSKAKRASRPGLAAVRTNMKVAGDYAVLDAALSMLGSSVPGSKVQQDYEANAAVRTLCDWWNANAPEGMREAGAFRVYAWNQDDTTFIAGDPEEPALQANQAENLPSYALFDADGDRPMVLLWFLRGRRFNTGEGGGTMIYSANGQPAYDLGLDLAEVDEAYYSLRGLESIKHRERHGLNWKHRRD